MSTQKLKKIFFIFIAPVNIFQTTATLRGNSAILILERGYKPLVFFVAFEPKHSELK